MPPEPDPPAAPPLAVPAPVPPLVLNPPPPAALVDPVLLVPVVEPAVVLLPDELFGFVRLGTELVAVGTAEFVGPAVLVPVPLVSVGTPEMPVGTAALVGPEVDEVAVFDVVEVGFVM